MLRLFNFTLRGVYIAFFLGGILLATACYGGTSDNDYVAWYKFDEYGRIIEQDDGGTNDNDYVVWYNRGVALSNLGRHEEALANYDKALKLKPDYYEAWNNRGNTLNELGRYEEALANCDKALKLKPDYYEAWYNRGSVLGKLGRYKEALASFDKAIKFKPDLPRAWTNRGIVLTNLGRYEEAIASFDAAIREALAFGDDGLVDLRVASSNRIRAIEAKAIASYDEALKFKPDDYETWYKRGSKLYNLGLYEEALTSFDKALKFKPDFHDAWNYRGSTLNKLGRHEEAMASYDKVREFKPKPQEKSALEQLIEQREDSCISPRGWGDLDILRFYYSGCCSSSTANRHSACERAETIFRNVQELSNMGSPKK